MFDEDGVKIGYRYTIAYEGYLFVGDNEKGWNRYGTDDFKEAMDMAHFYGDMIYVDDNEYGVTYHNGEWY